MSASAGVRRSASFWLLSRSWRFPANRSLEIRSRMRKPKENIQSPLTNLQTKPKESKRKIEKEHENEKEEEGEKGKTEMKTIHDLLKEGVVLGDGGYLIELERRGYVDSGSGREKVGTGKGSGQFTPEVAIENPDALRELHREFLNAGSQVLQTLTSFGTREKLNRAAYGAQTERINFAAVTLAKEVAGGHALVAGSVSRTQLTE